MGMDGAVGGQKTDSTKGLRRDISLGIQGDIDRKKENTTRLREKETKNIRCSKGQCFHIKITRKEKTKKTYVYHYISLFRYC